MVISSRTPEGTPNHCPVCGNDLRLEPSRPTLDAPCPHCGHLLWFTSDRPAAMGRQSADILKRYAESILELGIERFGPTPDPNIRHVLESIKDPERLKAILKRVLTCRSWEELLADR